MIAGQLDLRLSPARSATVQPRAAPSERSDDRWDVKPAWAFVAWRPNDAWLLRAGRWRLPLYLHSESLNIGMAHDMARLPVEMYSMAPCKEYKGLSALYSRPSTWLPESELGIGGLCRPH